MYRTTNPMTLICPRCGAKPRQLCIVFEGEMEVVHVERIEAAADDRFAAAFRGHGVTAGSPMWLKELIASLKQKCSRSTRGCADQEGTVIMRRLHELLDFEKPIETPSAEDPMKIT